MSDRKYRLVTRSDFDGLICAVLLKELDLIEHIKFVHPKDMQDGKIEINANDITTNLPYVPSAHLVFDHHLSETLRILGKKPDNHIIDPNAPSASRVVYNYFGGQKAFPNVNEEMIIAVDKADSAQFTREEILSPKAWVLLNYLMDPRSGLGRFKNFRISNYDLMMLLIDYCKKHTIDEILVLHDVKERIDLYFEHQKASMEQIEKCSAVHSNVVVLDLRHEDEIFTTNRFVIYALYPECNISVHVLWGLQKQNTVLAVGKSIIDRTSKTNIGELMLEYGGGGHKNAGTCQVPNEEADQILRELVKRINQDG
ncbi:MAG: exopolyphosphatase [Candidatus Parabeggiatoa sp. nov. 3]|nr:MAG: exopolyphosphatase [Gammaproteobacteria bacterium]RKZ68524.1 MAG: exopolyphosphatase [Gammaproteobacteria bacterium]RKZ83854.1 MAG: exopolyphosphatase [Gammaproteobacteria bacterium]